jgi:hypothetical protein
MKRDISTYSDEPIFTYTGVSVAPSWHCDANCSHCYIPPKLRLKDNYNCKLIELALDEMPESVRVIGFTGGEPFLHINRLYGLLKRASSAGRACTVITNAVWAKNGTHVKRILARAFTSGLRGLSVSLDDYHRPEAPFADVVRLLRYARDLGMIVGAQGVGVKAREKIDRLKATGVFSGQEDITGLINLENVGSAQSMPHKDLPSREIDTCLGAIAPVVTPDGSFYACCSPRLLKIRNPVLARGVIGRESIAEITYHAYRDYLLAAVIVFGPSGLMRLLGRRIPSGKFTRCELCLGVLEDPKAIRELHGRIADDIELRKEIVGRHMVLERCYFPDMPSVFQGGKVYTI